MLLEGTRLYQGTLIPTVSLNAWFQNSWQSQSPFLFILFRNFGLGKSKHIIKWWKTVRIKWNELYIDFWELENSLDFLAVFFMERSLHDCPCDIIVTLKIIISFSFSGMIILLRHKQLLHRNDNENFLNSLCSMVINHRWLYPTLHCNAASLAIDSISKHVIVACLP